MALLLMSLQITQLIYLNSCYSYPCRADKKKRSLKGIFMFFSKFLEVAVSWSSSLFSFCSTFTTSFWFIVKTFFLVEFLFTYCKYKFFATILTN